MEIGSIFLILALALLVGLFVARPLIENQKVESRPLDQTEHERSSLLAERDRIINALKELEFDSILGKIPEEDYPQQKALLMQRGAAVLRKLDSIVPEEAERSLDQEIETAFAIRRAESHSVVAVGSGNGKSVLGRSASVAVASAEDDLEVLLANRRRARKDKAAGFCPKCGNPLQKSDQFCPKCGTKTASGSH